MNYKQVEIKEIAETLTALGFSVYVAESGTHGIYTDSTGQRVVSFQWDLGGVKFSGNYLPAQKCGTGWGMETRGLPLTQESATFMLNATAPSWTGNTNPVYTTAAEHLAFYTASKYTLHQLGACAE